MRDEKIVVWFVLFDDEARRSSMAESSLHLYTQNHVVTFKVVMLRFSCSPQESQKIETLSWHLLTCFHRG